MNKAGGKVARHLGCAFHSKAGLLQDLGQVAAFCHNPFFPRSMTEDDRNSLWLDMVAT